MDVPPEERFKENCLDLLDEVKSDLKGKVVISSISDIHFYITMINSKTLIENYIKRTCDMWNEILSMNVKYLVDNINSLFIGFKQHIVDAFKNEIIALIDKDPDYLQFLYKYFLTFIKISCTYIKEKEFLVKDFDRDIFVKKTKLYELKA